jgi:hypothetical protein
MGSANSSQSHRGSEKPQMFTQICHPVVGSSHALPCHHGVYIGTGKSLREALVKERLWDKYRTRAVMFGDGKQTLTQIVQSHLDEILIAEFTGPGTLKANAMFRLNLQSDWTERYNWANTNMTAPKESAKVSLTALLTALETPSKYNLLFNNCEHSAAQISKGTRRSNQVEGGGGGVVGVLVVAVVAVGIGAALGRSKDEKRNRN